MPNDRERKAKSTRMAKSSKLVAVKRGRILLVRRRRDQLWMFPGGQKRERESEKDCLRREIKEELPKLKLADLLQVEDLFRRTKAIMRTRPIFHSSDAAIRGHVFCSFLALEHLGLPKRSDWQFTEAPSPFGVSRREPGNLRLRPAGL